MAIRDFHEKIAHGSVDEAQQAFHAAQKVIDKTAQKGPIHRNQAARRVSRLHKRLEAKRAG